jgi:hypothetical protein
VTILQLDFNTLSCLVFTSAFVFLNSFRFVPMLFFPMARQPLGGIGRLIFRGFAITHFRHTTVGRTPLEEGPARSRDLYLTTHNTHNRQTSMPPAGFEPAIPASERPQTHAVVSAATGIGLPMLHFHFKYNSYFTFPCAKLRREQFTLLTLQLVNYLKKVCKNFPKI